MADTYTLEAQPRTVTGKQVKALRRQDLIPAIIYGLGDPITISCPRRALEIVLQNAGSTHLINITVDGKTLNTLARQVQRDTIKRNVLHVDFLQVDLSKTIRTEVQVLLVNMPKLGADLLLAQNLMSVEVECLPTNIPDHIEVSVAHLTTAGARLTVAELPKLPNVQILAHGDDVVARVESLAVGAEEEVVEEGLTPLEPEVVERGKKQEEEEF